jgi:polyribonucleotide nucleotidyltransferase
MKTRQRRLNALEKHVKVARVIEDCVKKIKDDIPVIEQLFDGKTGLVNQQLIHEIMKFVEKKVGGSLKKSVDKCQLVRSILKELFPHLSEDQMSIIEKQIEYILDNVDVRGRHFFSSAIALAKSLLF